ncbi:late competence development ComFB family protein [Sporosarcina sp. USHLN248]|uniref:late competence development ComFB family protein n=1 Tax=Sporosarcina sp. USHLN248 TaxID=3081300 RepID=UPI0030192AD9
MGVHNVMEDVVREALNQNRASLHLTCDCHRCIDDIMAIALNQLPPQYIANEMHSPYVRASHQADRQGATNILSTVAKAAHIVSESPRCQTTKKE